MPLLPAVPITARPLVASASDSTAAAELDGPKVGLVASARSSVLSAPPLLLRPAKDRVTRRRLGRHGPLRGRHQPGAEPTHYACE